MSVSIIIIYIYNRCPASISSRGKGIICVGVLVDNETRRALRLRVLTVETAAWAALSNSALLNPDVAKRVAADIRGVTGKRRAFVTSRSLWQIFK